MHFPRSQVSKSSSLRTFGTRLCLPDDTGILRENESMNRQQLLDLYFLESRAKLIDLAAFLDRLDRAEGEADFRLAALRQAMEQLNRADDRRAEYVLLSLSDPTPAPIPAATTKAACGAWPGNA
jgi:hypothetical protein